MCPLSRRSRSPFVVGFCVLLASSVRGAPSDMDGDRGFDLQDYALLRLCVLGPGEAVPAASCSPARFDTDVDVDLNDFAGFQAVFGSSCGGVPTNDACRCSIDVGDGSSAYSNVLATTDGPEHSLCHYFGQSQVSSDIWYCYTATCTGTAFVSLCGSNYDTKLAVYSGCGCPAAGPLACSDDDCGRGVENIQSRVEVVVTQGHKYLIRVGGFVDQQGDGRLTIGCNVNGCAGAVGDCFSAHANPGCETATCCADTCELDQFCCDVEWDTTCAGEAQGVCTGNFPACTPTSGDCGVPDVTPGCGDNACCNTVCFNDPYCCLQEWDSTCVNEAESACFLTCTPGAGDCFTNHQVPGCNDIPCCKLVCTADPFCCDTGWDMTCVDLANEFCP